MSSTPSSHVSVSVATACKVVMAYTGKDAPNFVADQVSVVFEFAEVLAAEVNKGSLSLAYTRNTQSCAPPADPFVVLLNAQRFLRKEGRGDLVDKIKWPKNLESFRKLWQQETGLS